MYGLPPITLHAPATEDNYHMIGTDAIAKMKQDVIIINCAGAP